MTHILERHKSARGSFVELPSAHVIDLIPGAGLAFEVVNLEHSDVGESTRPRLLSTQA